MGSQRVQSPTTQGEAEGEVSSSILRYHEGNKSVLLKDEVSALNEQTASCRGATF